MLKGSAGQENFYDDITPEWNVPGSPLWCDLAMSRTLGLRQSVSGPRSGQCHRSREWYRGLVVALSGSGSEYRSLNGVDGLSPCLAGHSTLVRLGEDRGGRDQHLNTVRVLWSCVVFCLSSDSGSDAGLGSGRGRSTGSGLALSDCMLAVRVTQRLGGHWDLSHSRAGATAHHSCELLLSWHQDATSDASRPSPRSPETMRCGTDTGLSRQGSEFCTITVSLRRHRSRR